MRRRPSLKVFLKPAIAIAGDEVVAEVVLTSRSVTPVAELTLTLRGREVIGDGQHVHSSRSIVAQRAAFGPFTLEKGEHRRASRFPLPHDSTPSYTGRTIAVEYELDVHVSIPWWLDRRARFVIPVTRRAVDTPSAPARVFCNRTGRGSELYIEATFDDQRVEQNGSISGAISFANVAQVRIKRVELHFQARESVGAPSGKWQLDAATYVSTILDRAPTEGETARFHVRLPKDATVSFRTPHARLDWFVSIVAVVSLGEDARIEVPIEIVPAVGGARRRRAELPPVGHERRALLLRAAAERLQLDFTAESEELRTVVASSTMIIRLEPHDGAGLVAVAELTWPALGLDLELRERRWTDAFGEELDLSDAAFRKRFFVRASEAERASLMFDDGVRESFASLTEVEVDDEGAVLARPISVQSVDSVVDDLGPTLDTARRLADAAARIAPSIGYR